MFVCIGGILDFMDGEPQDFVYIKIHEKNIATFLWIRDIDRRGIKTRLLSSIYLTILDFYVKK